MAPLIEEPHIEPYGEEVSEQEQRALQQVAQRSSARLSALESRWLADDSNANGPASELGEHVLQAVREQAPAAAGSLQMECRSTLCKFRLPSAMVASVLAPMHTAIGEQPAQLTVLPRGGIELSALEVVLDVASDDFSGLGGI